jgi:hypothetical protein
MTDKEIEIQFGLLTKFMNAIIDLNIMNIKWYNLLNHGYWIEIKYKDKVGYYQYDQTNTPVDIDESNIEYIKVKPKVSSYPILLQLDINKSELEWIYNNITNN